MSDITLFDIEPQRCAYGGLLDKTGQCTHEREFRRDCAFAGLDPDSFPDRGWCWTDATHKSHVKPNAGNTHSVTLEVGNE